MTRLLSLPLLLVLILPVFAQVESPDVANALARDPALLTRMREQLTAELQHIQEMLVVVNDAQLIETLKTRQADLTKQLLEVTQQVQQTPAVGRTSNTRTPELPQPMMPGMMPPRTPEPGVMTPDPRGGNFTTTPTFPRNDHYQVPQMMPPGMPGPPQVPGMNYHPTTPVPFPGGNYATPPWGDPDRMWDATPWGPRLPKELVETKQSIDSLRKEIADLKETVKALETQIQLLTRNILLERMKEKESGHSVTDVVTGPR